MSSFRLKTCVRVLNLDHTLIHIKQRSFYVLIIWLILLLLFQLMWRFWHFFWFPFVSFFLKTRGEVWFSNRRMHSFIKGLWWRVCSFARTWTCWGCLFKIPFVCWVKVWFKSSFNWRFCISYQIKRILNLLWNTLLFLKWICCNCCWFFSFRFLWFCFLFVCGGQPILFLLLNSSFLRQWRFLLLLLDRLVNLVKIELNTARRIFGLRLLLN